ncbi:hypothetical protein VIGAN_04166300, partial [Vigna angularis var. angularis]
MKNKRNKQNLRRNAPKGLTSQLGIEDDDEVLYPLDLADLRKDVECPICLGIIRNTRMVMECMHRFCKECIEKSFRLGNNECPACRTHCSSRRSLREDIVFDEVIAVVFPNIDEYEKKEIAFSDDAKNNIKSMQEAYGQTLERQNEALRKKAAAAAASGSKDKYSRSGTQTLRRSARNESAFSESSSSRDMTLPPIAEERETQVIPVRDFADLQIQPQSSQHETNARTVAGGTIQSLIASSDKLVWGRFGPR